MGETAGQTVSEGNKLHLPAPLKLTVTKDATFLSIK